jgi:collagen type VII alpha
MDSLIRLRQLNQPDLSGFISQVLFPALRTSGISVGGDILPTGSGIFDLGSAASPYDAIYGKRIFVPSGSGIFFGNDFFTAFQSGGTGVIRINNITITSSAQGLSIIGPTGPTGPTGPSGATGISGVGVTGAVSQNNTFRLLFSNGTSGVALPLPSGATGATGIGLTGLYQSGNTIRGLFSNGVTGGPITLPSGATGPQGIVGGIAIDMSQMTGFHTGEQAPQVTIFNIDPFDNTNPDIDLVRGMTYQLGYSGLNLNTVTITGTGTFNTNYFVESGVTGYLKFAIFDSTVLSTSVGNPYTGRFIRPETGWSPSTFSTLDALDETANAFYNITEGALKSSLTITTRLSADDSYKYGFRKYALSDGSLLDSTMNWGFYVLGNLTLSHFGPTGPSGANGAQGIPGPQGERGPAGVSVPGVSVTGIERNGNDIRFLLSDGTVTAYTTLPAGGPSGATGPQGSTGPSGVQGPQGIQGPEGIADRYYASFFPNDISISGFVGGFNKQISGTAVWQLCTGTGRVFTPGDKIWFVNPAFIDKTYSASLQLIFSDGNYSGTRYFYGMVNTFNSNNGEIQFTVQSTPYPPVGLVGGNVIWTGYNLFNTNLGGLGSPGPTGPTGPQGAVGDTGHQTFTNAPLSGLTPVVLTYLDTRHYDSFNLYFTSAENYIYLNTGIFSTGQTVLVKIKNSGNSFLTNDSEPKLIYWDPIIVFPYGVSAPAPNPNFTNIYTFIRFPDINGLPQILCTYSVNYNI